MVPCRPFWNIAASPPWPWTPLSVREQALAPSLLSLSVAYLRFRGHLVVLKTRQPIAVSDISSYICLIDIRGKSKEQLNERRAGLSLESFIIRWSCLYKYVSNWLDLYMYFFLLCFFHVCYLSVHSNQSTMKLIRTSSKFSTGSNLV